MTIDSLPVLIGAGQAMEQPNGDPARISSYCDLAEKAVNRALADTAAAKVAEEIDVVAAVRTFEDSLPGGERAFNGPRNLPGAVAQRVGASPLQAIYEKLGGQTPQQLVNEFAEKIHSGDCDAALLFGAEVIGNVRSARRSGIELDWSERVESGFEDRGGNEVLELMTPETTRHRLLAPMQFYALMETARRAELGLSKDAYARAMGEAFAPFSRVAARHPFAQFPQALSVDEIIRPGPGNPMLVSPYTRNLVAKDGVNQAAALIMTSAGRARALGVPEDRWVFLHGFADTTEIDLMQRPRLGRSEALRQALGGALSMATKQAAEIEYFDIYSCFPIVVLNACDALGISPDDPRQLTQTGGLPYFGGPGNNYAMHGIASMVETLRGDPGHFGMVLGNGGFMSRFSTGIYATSPPRDWRTRDGSILQRRVDRQPSIRLNTEPVGVGIVESFLVNYLRGIPVDAAIVGRLHGGKERFIAVSRPEADDTLRAFVDADPLGQKVQVSSTPEVNTFELMC